MSKTTGSAPTHLTRCSFWTEFPNNAFHKDFACEGGGV